MIIATHKEIVNIGAKKGNILGLESLSSLNPYVIKAITKQKPPSNRKLIGIVFPTKLNTIPNKLTTHQANIIMRSADVFLLDIK